MRFSLFSAILIIAIVFSPTYFRDPESTIVSDLKQLFATSSQPEPLDIENSQNVVLQVVVTKANNLRMTEKNKTNLVKRLYRLSKEFEKFKGNSTAVDPTDKKQFQKFSNLAIDYLATSYAIYFLDYGAYPETIPEELSSLFAIPVDGETPVDAIIEHGKADKKDYLSEATK
jgi:hypothetical protein